MVCDFVVLVLFAVLFCYWLVYSLNLVCCALVGFGFDFGCVLVVLFRLV